MLLLFQSLLCCFSRYLVVSFVTLLFHSLLSCFSRFFVVSLATQLFHSLLCSFSCYLVVAVVSLLFELKKIFIEIAREDFCDDVEFYRSCHFKILLQGVWPELTFVYQNGKSDLVCSKEVTVGEALRYYKELEQSKDHNIE